MLKTLTLTLLCSQLCVNSLEPEHFISHLLSNLKDDILHLKPGSNKTYILKSKLLGRNDSIELDIKSRTKAANKDTKDAKETVHDVHSDQYNVHGRLESHKHVKKHAKHGATLNEKRQKLRRHHKLREAMLKEIEEIRDKHNEKIKDLMKHKQHGRKKIRIKVIRKHKEEEGDKVTNETKAELKAADKPQIKIVKTLYLHHIPGV
ncbi:hypothetical protein WDU94_007533 [Cyamophila willieti]